MIWWFSSTRHDMAIGSFARRWIAGGMLDRLIMLIIPASVWWFFTSFFFLDPDTFAIGLLLGAFPWLFWVADAIVDHYHVKGDLAKYLSQDDVILATRCEYVGGHPQLPHGRFAYLLLEGTRQNPSLSVGFPAPPGQPIESLSMPVLDLNKTKPESQSEQSLAGSILAALDEKAGKAFQSERVTLVVDYAGHAGRKHKVELTHFFHGNDEIRNWRNYLVCAQAEADTGIRPHEPWKSLKDVPLVEEVTGGASRNGHENRKPSSAFARR